MVLKKVIKQEPDRAYELKQKIEIYEKQNYFDTLHIKSIIGMTPQQRQALNAEWNNYYTQVAASPIGQLRQRYAKGERFTTEQIELAKAQSQIDKPALPDYQGLKQKHEGYIKALFDLIELGKNNRLKTVDTI